MADNIIVYTIGANGQIQITSSGTVQGIPVITPSGQITQPAQPTYIDTLSLSFISPTGAQELFGAGYSGSSVQGPQKLAQRFLLHLLTVRASILYRPTIGTNFIPTLQAKASTELDVFTAFLAAMTIVGPNMTAEELATDPPNERFANATMTQLTVGAAFSSAGIAIQNLAGTTSNLSLPLTFLI